MQLIHLTSGGLVFKFQYCHSFTVLSTSYLPLVSSSIIKGAVMGVAWGGWEDYINFSKTFKEFILLPMNVY